MGVQLNDKILDQDLPFHIPAECQLMSLDQLQCFIQSPVNVTGDIVFDLILFEQFRQLLPFAFAGVKLPGQGLWLQYFDQVEEFLTERSHFQLKGPDGFGQCLLFQVGKGAVLVLCHDVGIEQE